MALADASLASAGDPPPHRRTRMEPLDPIHPAHPVVPLTPGRLARPPVTSLPAASPATRPNRLGGVSRGLATLGLAVALLAVGGAAAVMAASPEPSASTSPGTTPSTQPSTTDGAGTTDHPKGPCPADADGTAPSDGTTPSTSATPSAPSTAPSTPTT
jgi:hypothetical protein